MGLKKKVFGMKRAKKPQESSFTLIETVIAIGLMVTVVLEVAGVHGRAIDFSAYGRRSTEAIYLAKAKLSQIENAWSYLPFEELKITTPSEEKFDESLCSPNPDFGCDYTYVASIQDWKLPLLEMFAGDEPTPEMQMVQEYAKKIFGDSILKIARVEVFWPEGGASRGSVALTTLLTNQRAIDEVVHTLPAYPPKSGKESKKTSPDDKKGAPKRPPKPNPVGGEDQPDPSNAEDREGREEERREERQEEEE